jgi:streptogramin lyase
MAISLGIRSRRWLLLSALSAGMLLAASAPVVSADPVGAVQSFPIPSLDGYFAGAEGIAAGPDGNLWFTQSNRGVLSRITTGGVRTDFNTLSSVSSGGGACGVGGCNFSSSVPAELALGSDGRMWFPQYKRGGIGAIATDGSTYEGAPAGVGGYRIAAGPDGNLWETQYNPGSIARVTTGGSLTPFTSGLTAGANVYGITAGPDGAMWFVEPNRAAIGRITTGGFVTETTTGITTGSSPWSIVTGPDGNLWFTEFDADAIGRLNPTTGTVTEFHSGITAGAKPSSITVGPDGNLWFSENGRGVARITTAGEVAEYPLTLAAGENPSAITSGPDGNVWFSDGRNKIEKIGTGVPAAVQGAPSVTGSHLVGDSQICAGAQFATWGGQQPSITAVSWTLNGAPAGSGNSFTPTAPGQLSCAVSASYGAQRVPVSSGSAAVTVASKPAKIRRTTCKIKKVKKKLTLSCSTKLVDASTKLAKPKKSKSVTLKFKRGKKTYRVKAIQTSKQLQLLAPAALPKGTYKVKVSGQTVKLKLG